MNNKSIALVNEIVGLIITNQLNSNGINAIKNNPQEFINSRANIKLNPNLTINIVDNSDESINLILPYYENLNNIKAQKINENNLNAISGGYEDSRNNQEFATFYSDVISKGLYTDENYPHQDSEGNTLPDDYYSWSWY